MNDEQRIAVVETKVDLLGQRTERIEDKLDTVKEQLDRIEGSRQEARRRVDRKTYYISGIAAAGVSGAITALLYFLHAVI